MADELQEILKNLRSVIIANGLDGVPIRFLEREYYEFHSEKLNYSKFGYTSLESFLRNECRKACDIRMSRNNPPVKTAFMVADATTKHMKEMQEKSRKKSKSKKGRTRNSNQTRWPNPIGSQHKKYSVSTSNRQETSQTTIQPSNNYKTTSDGKYGNYVVSILRNRPFGAFKKNVEDIYSKTFKENLPDSWIQKLVENRLIEIVKKYPNGIVIVKNLSRETTNDEHSSAEASTKVEVTDASSIQSRQSPELVNDVETFCGDFGYRNADQNGFTSEISSDSSIDDSDSESDLYSSWTSDEAEEEGFTKDQIIQQESSSPLQGVKLKPAKLLHATKCNDELDNRNQQEKPVNNPSSLSTRSKEANASEEEALLVFCLNCSFHMRGLANEIQRCQSCGSPDIIDLKLCM